MRHYFTCLLCLLSWSAFSQPTKTIPPSPEATAAFKFAEVPVSLYTGVPNTSVEIYQIKTKGLTIPVSVNYHSRGIQVSEIASRVGLGWALNYGGMISRQVRSKPDDESSYGMMYKSDYNILFTSRTAQSFYQDDIINGRVDETPDQFFFDANGTSGKFTIDPTDSTILLQKYDDLKISFILNSEGIITNQAPEAIIGWRVVDKLGNTYYYGISKNKLRNAYDWDHTEYTNYVASPPFAIGAPRSGDGTKTFNTWHLMEIETPYKEKIEFFYEEETTFSVRRSYDTLKDDIAYCYFTKVMAHQQQIEKILFTNGKVSFISKTEGRSDLTNGKALDQVHVLSGQDTLKSISFFQSYTTSIDNSNLMQHLRTLDPSSNYRMLLDSLQERGHDGIRKPSYRFVYNKTLLPNRFSNSQDNWGYYNGKPNGQFLTFYEYRINANINREVDTVLAEASLLKKVIYPSGGSASFTYEHNKAVPPHYINKLLYPNNNPVRTIDGFHPMMKMAKYYRLDTTYYDTGFFTRGVYTDTVTIGPGIKGQVSVSMDLGQTCRDDPGNYCSYSVNLRGYGQLYHPNLTVTSFTVPAGKYIIDVKPLGVHDPANPDHFFYFKMNWKEEISVDKMMYAAGKRIKRIEYQNEDGTAQFKEYDYEGGRIFGLPNFYFIDTHDGSFSSVDAHGSMPGSPLTSLQGNNIGYEYVTEYFGNNTTNHGKIEHKFSIVEDGGTFYKFPYTIPIDNEWLRGKSLSTKIYERSEGDITSYYQRRSVENSYLYAGEFFHEGIFLTPFIPVNPNYVYSKSRFLFYRPFMILTKNPIYPDDADAPPLIKVFYVTGGIMDLQKTIETDYFPGGKTLQKTTNYFYDYDKHYQSARMEMITSKKEKLISETTYPLSLVEASRDTSVQELVRQHRLAEVLRTETVVQDSTGLELARTGQRTGYHTFGNGLVLPDSVESSINGAPWQLDAQFKYYDAAANPVEVLGKDGIRTSYVWAYNKTLPIAEVKHAAASQVFHTSFEEEGFAGPGARTGNRYHAGAYTFTPPTGFTALPGSTLTYWSWSNVTGKWTPVAQPYSGGAVTCTGDRVDEVRILPPGAMMTTYTYDPLVGMRSATDANGNTTYYEYDGFGRLQAVRDHEGNILKTYQYHYQTNQ